MYGYSFPKRPDASKIRILVCESELRHYREAFPELGRAEILEIMRDRPLRAIVEEALRRAVERHRGR